MMSAGVAVTSSPTAAAAAAAAGGGSFASAPAASPQAHTPHATSASLAHNALHAAQMNGSHVPSHSHTGASSASHTHAATPSGVQPVLPRPQVFGGGRQGAKPYQEDSFFSWCSPTNRVIVGGIFDGHGGYNGLLASQTARDEALAYLQANALECEEWSVDRWRKALGELFDHLHSSIRQSFIANYSPSAPGPANSFTNTKPPQEQRHVDARGIVRNANGDPIHGGSTATLVVMVKDANGAGATLITANVGDSTAFLVPTRGTWDFLSVDHGPENQDEWVRVNTSPAESARYPTKLLFVYDKTNVFRKYECPCVFLPDGTKDQQYVANPWGYGLHPTNVRYEPAVYAVTPRSISKDSTCIAMTRALGDFYAHQFGLTHVPSISVKRISCADCDSNDTTQLHTNSYATSEQAYTVFVASDGVWDCWRYDDLMQFINDELIQRGKTLLEMGEAVLEESISRAITNFGAKHYDDACLVVWQFTPTKAPQCADGTMQQQQQTHSQSSSASSASSSANYSSSSSAATSVPSSASTNGSSQHSQPHDASSMSD